MSRDDKFNSVSMEALARFAIMEGAAELIDAYGRIPAGPLRDNLVQQAKIIADQYSGTNPAYRPAEEPIRRIGGGRAALPAPTTSRTGKAPPTEDWRTEAVRLRLEKVPVKEIAETLNITTQQVYQATFEARKAGVKFPRTPSAVAIQPGTKTWVTDLRELSGQGRRQVELAAAKRGIKPEQYIARRQLALKMAQEGHGYERILDATGEPSAKIVSAWLSAARGAGYNVPYVTFLMAPEGEPEPEAEPEPEVQDVTVAPVGRVFPNLIDLGKTRAAQVLDAADRRGMTAQAYLDMRESIVRHRLDGRAPAAIQAATGQGRDFVKDTIRAAEKLGVTFPALRLNAMEAPELVTAQPDRASG